MLPFSRFSYQAPDRWDDLLAVVAQPDARIIAGGTDLLPSLKHRLVDPHVLVSLRRMDHLRAIHLDGQDLSIGAMATIQDLRRSELVAQRYPALVAACATIATATIQAMATLGGNLMLDTRCIFYNQPQGWRESIGGCLKTGGTVCHVAGKGGCHAAHSADTVPALWLYGARVELRSQQGTRQVKLSELYSAQDGRRWLKMQPGEVLSRVLLPPPLAPVSHYKVRLRQAIDYGALLVAVQTQGDGARAVLSAIGPAPIEVSASLAAELPDVVYHAARPLNTHAVSTSWRKHMARVATKRALEALQMASS